MNTKISNRFIFLFSLCIFGLAITPALAFQDDNGAKPLSVKLAHIKSRIGFIELNLTGAAPTIELKAREIIEIEAAVKEVAAKRGKMDSVLDRVSVSPASFDEVIRMLQTQKVQMTIELAGFEARFNGVQEIQQRSKLRHQKRFSKTKGILQQLFDSQNLDLERAVTLRERGMISESDIRKIKMKILETEIRTAEIEESGGDAQWNEFENQLTATSLDKAETSAKLITIDKLLVEYTSTRSIVSKSRSLDKEYDGYLRKLAELKTSHQKARNEIDFQLKIRDQLKIELKDLEAQISDE